ncbi:MAG: nucleotidyl transferase AbiEii/AbiGii toxin family protein [Ruthenibacterium sp.]
MISPTGLKAKVRNIAKEKGISAQIVLQNYMLERFLERISKSNYRDKFIIKGGFLIASMVGLDTRSTMDMDATLKGIPVDEITIKNIFSEIAQIAINDDITFIFTKIEEIRENDDYSGFRVSLTANLPPLSVPLKFDITTGDKITPKEISFNYRLLFENRTIEVLSYNLETILAEKIETIISRADLNTRPRDFYDVYILSKLYGQTINYDTLKSALKATSEKRGSIHLLTEYKNLLNKIWNSATMNNYWNNYCADFNYAKDIDFSVVCSSVEELLDEIYQ